MKPQRRKEKILGYNSVPSSAAAMVPLAQLGNGFGTTASSSSTAGVTPTSGVPARAKNEKQSYNACPPPPGLYEPPPPAGGASYSEKGKAGAAAAAALASSGGNSSDTDKKGRRRPGRKLRQVADSDLSVSGNPDGGFAAGPISQEGPKDGAVPSRASASNLNPVPDNPSFKAKPLQESSSTNSVMVGKLVNKSESKAVDRTSLEKGLAQASVSSEHASSSSKSSALPSPSPADASCTVEYGSGQKAKSKESAPIAIPKPKSKDPIKGPKPNAGLCSKRSNSLGADPRQPSQKGWRPCTTSDSTPTNYSGGFDGPDVYGNSCAPLKAAEVASSSGRSSDGCVSDSHHPLADFAICAAPDVYGSGSPYLPTNGGIAGNAYGNDATRSKPFTEHLSQEDAARAVEAGLAYKGVLRVNRHYRLEAYVPLDGVPVDVLIDGLEAQNRAMEGDVVVFGLTPVSQWPRMKGVNNNKPSVGISESNSHFTVTSPTQTGGRRASVDDMMLESESSSPTESSPVGLWDSSGEDAEERLLSEGSPGMYLETSYPRSDVGFWNDTMRPKRGSSEHEADGKSSCNGKGPKASLSNGTQKAAFDASLSEAPLARLAAQVQSMPGRRPCGKVLAIVGKSRRRDAVVGFLEVYRNGYGGKGNGIGLDGTPPKAYKKQAGKALGKVTFVPVDPRFSKMVVLGSTVPEHLSRRIRDNDPTVPTELVVARVEEWKADVEFPLACVTKCLGSGGTMEAQMEAILCENAIHDADFPASCLACLPKVPWTIPEKELKYRRDFRGLRIFSIDPPTAKDLDDALSFDQLPNGDIRIGVHIADVSYFVRPDSALDKEAQKRSTSVYLIQKVLPMLPPLLCEELCSLNPGVDRLAFSVVWTMDSSGNIVDQWIGRAIIRSCAKLTYGQVQDMIDDAILGAGEKMCVEGEDEGRSLPPLYGNHSWEEIKADVLNLHGVAKRRRVSRYDGGALKLENSKLVFSLDEDGKPYDSAIYKYQDSNFLVEEFTLLANMTIAKVISSAFPDRALLRRHPEPNIRKLKEFEQFCVKKGFEIDTSTSGALHLSLEKLRENFEDPVMLNILMLFATKPMQLAKYFCTGEFKDSEVDWAHYALAVPFYTHFTSPIRRYPDLIVHRTVAAALEAERDIGWRNRWPGRNESQLEPYRLFTGTMTGKDAHCTDLAQKALLVAAERHKIPQMSELSLVASHCNERRLASNNVKYASDNLYLWSMLKSKQGMLSNARVLALGPKFMSIYVCKIANRPNFGAAVVVGPNQLERRIYYDEIDGLNAEWFEATGTLVLTISDRIVQKKYAPVKGKPKRTIADVAVLVNPTDINSANSEEETLEDLVREVEDRLAGKLVSEDEANEADGTDVEVEPAVLPLTLRWFSSLPVSVHAVGGEGRPLEIGVRLYVSSYAM